MTWSAHSAPRLENITNDLVFSAKVGIIHSYILPDCWGKEEKEV